MEKTDLMKALEETSEALEFALLRLGCCGNGDGEGRKADVDSYGGMESSFFRLLPRGLKEM